MRERNYGCIVCVFVCVCVCFFWLFKMYCVLYVCNSYTPAPTQTPEPDYQRGEAIGITFISMGVASIIAMLAYHIQLKSHGLCLLFFCCFYFCIFLKFCCVGSVDKCVCV